MNYFNTIEDCPLEVFKNVQLKNDFKLLLIDGVYDESKAKDSWNQLYDSYNSAVKSKSNNTGFENNKQLQILQGEYQIIRACIFMISHKLEVNVLSNMMPKELKTELLDYDNEVKILNRFGFKFDIDKVDKELIRVDKQSKNHITKIKILQKRVEEDSLKDNDSTINDTIFICQKHQGFAFLKDSKVIDLVSCLNDLIRHNESLKKQNKKR